MAIVDNSLEIVGKNLVPIIEDILHINKTVGQDLVTFESDIKGNTIFTEASAVATMQAYDGLSPASSGSLDTWDTKVSPFLAQFYQAFNPLTLRLSRYQYSMDPSAWNYFSTEFQRIVIGGIYANEISLSAERNFWLGATAGTKSALAGLTPGTAQTSISTEEQAMVAGSLGVGAFFDGVLTKVLYNNSRATGTAQLGERIKVVGTTITAVNIKDEYAKIYTAIPSEVLEGLEMPMIYAPYSHRQLIAEYNNNVANFKDAFLVSGDTYSYNGVRIVFVPFPENVIYCARKSHIFWLTDLMSDLSFMKLERVQNNSEEMFVKNVMAIGAHVANQKFNVLYVG